MSIAVGSDNGNGARFIESSLRVERRERGRERGHRELFLRSSTVLVTSFGYDSAGNQNEVTDPKGIVTLSMFDPLGNVTQTIQDDGSGLLNNTTNYTYGPAGMTATTPTKP